MMREITLIAQLVQSIIFNSSFKPFNFICGEKCGWSHKVGQPKTLHAESRKRLLRRQHDFVTPILSLWKADLAQSKSCFPNVLRVTSNLQFHELPVDILEDWKFPHADAHDPFLPLIPPLPTTMGKLTSTIGIPIKLLNEAQVSNLLNPFLGI